MINKHLTRLRQGDNSALTDIYNLTKNAVFSICYSYMRNYQTAQDLMQDTYVNIIKHILKFKDGYNGRAWIHTIAKNLCLNELKKRKRETCVDFSLRDDLAGGYEQALPDESGIIALACKVLSDNELKIVMMHTIGGIKLKEIAQILQSPQGTVRWQYNNALNKLRKNLASIGELK
jgi:RNA polymerase sigma-70 factor (ECF subfamily)